MPINRQDLIAIAKGLRVKKDRTKEMIKNGRFYEKHFLNQVVIPRQLFDASVDLESDKWFFNGFVIKHGHRLFVVDPGVSFYARFIAAGLSPLDISALFLSHGHTDHCGDMVVFIEKILRNKSKKIKVFIAKTAFESEIPLYHRDKLKEAEHIDLKLLNDKDSDLRFDLFDGLKIEFISLFHSVPDTFGFKLAVGDQKFGYVSDTGYAVKVETDRGEYPPEAIRGKFKGIIKRHDYIRDFYQDVNTAIVNINDLHYNRHSKYHLSGWDVLDLFKGSRLKRLILQHLSPLDIEGEDSSYIYKLFFSDQSYKTVLPHYLGKMISL